MFKGWGSTLNRSSATIAPPSRRISISLSWVGCVGRFTVVPCPLLLDTRVDPSGFLGRVRILLWCRYHEPWAMYLACSVAMRLMYVLCGIDLLIILRCAYLKPQHRRGVFSQTPPERYCRHGDLHQLAISA
eukprot:2733887-Amphidinium_carterae.1